jgi:hypothetical protein
MGRCLYDRKGGSMDRRAFVRGLFGVAAAAATVTVLMPIEAEALPVATPEVPKAEAERTESDYRPEVDGVPSTENVQYYYRRRRFRRRVYYRRPRVYRRVYYRRPVYRPIYRRPYYF